MTESETENKENGKIEIKEPIIIADFELKTPNVNTDIKEYSNDITYQGKSQNFLVKIGKKTLDISTTDLKRWLGFSGFVFYFWSDKSLNCSIYPLPRIPMLLRMKSKNEMFLLHEPAMFIEGKPTFFCLRNFPISITMGMFKIRRLRKQLQAQGFSASEIEAMLNSIHVNSLFRKYRLSPTQLLLIAMSNLVCILLTYIIMLNYHIFVGAE